MTSGTNAELRDALTRWTGFQHVYFVESASAACRLALDVLTPPGCNILLPAIACWTLTQVVLERGRWPKYADVDERLGIAPTPQDASADFGASIAVYPWGNPIDKRAISRLPGVRIADLSLAIHGQMDMAFAEDFDAAIISLGRGKPWDVGAGGVLLLRDDAAAHEVRDRILFGYRKLKWVRRGERYVFAPSLYDLAARKWHELCDQRERQVQDRSRWCEHLAVSGGWIDAVAVEDPITYGATNLVPLILAADYPLTAHDVYCVAICEGVPIGTQPVSPAYLEPAALDLDGHCPKAEAVKDRLLFIPTTSLNDRTIDQLMNFVSELERRSETFRRPYPIQSSAEVVPVDHWRDYGLLCRGFNEEFAVHDALEGKIYRVPMEIAAALQKMDGKH